MEERIIIFVNLTEVTDTGCFKTVAVLLSVIIPRTKPWIYKQRKYARAG